MTNDLGRRITTNHQWLRRILTNLTHVLRTAQSSVDLAAMNELTDYLDNWMRVSRIARSQVD